MTSERDVEAAIRNKFPEMAYGDYEGAAKAAILAYRNGEEVRGLVEALEDIARNYSDGESYSGTACASIAAKALATFKGERDDV